MILPYLKIGGVEIDLHAYPVRQGFGRIEGATIHRMMSGAAIKQTHWQKLSIQIEGNGWAPPALAGIDWSVPVEIACVTPRSINSATNTATLPAARRTDHANAVLARAVVDGKLVETPVVVVVNAATATVVSGASSYQFWYYPKVNCISNGPDESLQLDAGVFGWSLVAEEV